MRSTDVTTIVVIGATGHFGARFCRRIIDEPGIELVVTSRNSDRAAALSGELAALGLQSHSRPQALDQSSPAFRDQLRRLAPDIVVHTAGPYQGQDYSVAAACIDCGCHYIDLADGRDFVHGFESLDQRAREAGVLLVSGASTVPGLSSAVVETMSTDLETLQEVEISIAPAHRTPRGSATVAAVLSYCGRPFEVLIGGRWCRRYGWQALTLQKHPHLGRRLAAACDVPDLSLLPRRYSTLRTVTFQAALEAPWEHIGLWLMAWLVRARLLRNVGRFGPTVLAISRRLERLGSDVGGMQVRVAGIDGGGNSAQRTWYLTACDNHGPEIPVTPALILTRRLVRGTLDLRGAYPCVGLISLSEFEAEVSALSISWEVAA